MPYNEHVATIQPRQNDQKLKRTRGSGGQKIAGAVIPENVAVFWNLDGTHGEPTEIRFPVSEFSEDQARTWLVENRVKYDVFTPAEDKEENAPCYHAVVNKATKTLEITLHDEIGFWGTQSKEFTQLLNENKNISTINIDINSPGGVVFDGFSIYNNLKSHPATVNIKVSGVAASIASVIAMAGDNIDMPENSMMMIHKPMINFLMNNDADKLRKNADVLDKMEKGIIAAYRSRTEKSESELATMLAETTWFTAKEAKDIGFADTVSDEIEVKNFFDFNTFEYAVPVNVLNAYDINHGPKELNFTVDAETENGFNKLLNKLKSHFKPIEKEPENMDLKELETTVNSLTETVNKLTVGQEAKDAEIASLKAENASLTAAVSQVTATLNNQAVNVQTEKYRTFCNDLVKQGRVLPADVDSHVNTMDLKFQADEKGFTAEKKETPALDAFKKFLSALPVTVPIDDRHVANKDGAPAPVKKMGEDAILNAINKIMADEKIEYRVAQEKFYKDNPTLLPE